MRLLLDTHVFLWYITADPRLPAPFLSAIGESTNEVFLSVASVWEAVVKHASGKLPLPALPAEYLPQQRDDHGIASLPIDEGAMTHLAKLPALHRDPFDRLLIAQALEHEMTILTVDAYVAAYPVPQLAPGLIPGLGGPSLRRWPGCYRHPGRSVDENAGDLATDEHRFTRMGSRGLAEPCCDRVSRPGPVPVPRSQLEIAVPAVPVYKEGMHRSTAAPCYRPVQAKGVRPR